MPSWTTQEVYFLRRYFGRKPINWLALRLNRTTNAVWCRANKLNLTSKGKTHALSDLIRDTGYNWKQLLKAKKELEQEWERHKKKKGSKYLVTDEQKEELLRHLAKPGPKFSKEIIFWFKPLKIQRCMRCRNSKDEHYMAGLCEDCYMDLTKVTYKLKLHEKLVTYWKLAHSLQVTPHKAHPIRQLASWQSINDASVAILRISVVH